ncbi:MAG: hypothetical protein JNK75_14410 [Betaproteobacteria bacterium]|nr:hypothetical protein [Betaproteobacteria bacterium]
MRAWTQLGSQSIAFFCGAISVGILFSATPLFFPAHSDPAFGQFGGFLVNVARLIPICAVASGAYVAGIRFLAFEIKPISSAALGFVAALSGVFAAVISTSLFVGASSMVLVSIGVPAALIAAKSARKT